MRDKATKRPWDYKLNQNSATIYSLREGYEKIFNNHSLKQIAVVKWRMIPEELCEENARLIVKAVNMHDELIHACKWALACMKDHDTSLKEELKRLIEESEPINDK